MSLKHYPAAPLNTAAIQPSAEFKQEAFKVVGAIILFFIVYLLLIAAAIGLAVGCFYLAAVIVAAFPRLYTLLAALGLAGVGVGVIFFLIKFIFSSSKDEDPNRVQIFEKDEPELFAFIRQLAVDTKTKFPKKIFVSPEVNAAVFYNSNFWSMFFPVRKNLVIGLGLVNSVNLSEFKAIMAHEFGHFSQQSMKLGSFTYNVNRIIYNMLFENTGYQNALGRWGSIHGILSIFVSITVSIAQAIQSILKSMYSVVNKSYFGLSRQMEFNADAIAASVAGGNNLVSALYRLELSNGSYSSALRKADDFLKEKLISNNIFSNQFSIMNLVAAEHKLPLQGGLPQVTPQFLQTFSNSRINYKDQWSSHPTNQERETELGLLGMNAEPETGSAWLLFADAERIQHTMTRHIYRDVKNVQELASFENDLFEKRYAEETSKYVLPGVYKGYYNRRLPNAEGWMDALHEEKTGMLSVHDLLNDEMISLPEQVRNNESDVEVLKAITEKRIDVKSFDFEGEKYDAALAVDVMQKLLDELKEQQTRLADNDKKSFLLSYMQAKANDQQAADELLKACNRYSILNQDTEQFYKLSANIFDTISPFYRGGLTIEQVSGGVQSIKDNYEIKLKARLREILADDWLSAFFAPELADKMNAFASSNYYYFMGNEFENDALDAIIHVCNEASSVLADARFAAYKNMLVLQARAIPEKEMQLRVA